MTADVEAILSSYRTWAVVGWSPDPFRASNGVAEFLRAKGCRVIPVNPQAAGEQALGETVRASLAEAVEADGPIEVVDIFRRADQAGAHVDEAIGAGAKAVWMQLGVIDHGAAQRARDAGLRVVMDRCPKIEWR